MEQIYEIGQEVWLVEDGRVRCRKITAVALVWVGESWVQNFYYSVEENQDPEAVSCPLPQDRLFASKEELAEELLR